MYKKREFEKQEKITTTSNISIYTQKKTNPIIYRKTTTKKT